MHVQKQIPAAILLIITAGIIISCNNQKRQTQGKMPPQERSVVTLSERTVTVQTEYPATVRGQQVIEIRPKIDGYVEAIYVNEGASVKKGQSLFRISNPIYEEQVRTAQASIKSAEADVFTAQMQVKKVTPLVEKDIVSKFELESAQYNLQAKQATMAQAKAALANAETNVGYTLVKSPLDGVIGEIPYKIGALVSSNTSEPLTTLSDVTNIYAYFSVNEKDFGSYKLSEGILRDKKGGKLKASLVLSGNQESPETGQVELASGLITTETGSINLKAVFPNKKGLIRSGASAIVKLPETFDSALLIPQSASFEILNKRLVYKVMPDNKVLSVPVQTIPTNDGQFFIIRDGLKAGDRVIFGGIIGLKDSMLIVPKKILDDSIYSVQTRVKQQTK